MPRFPLLLLVLAGCTAPDEAVTVDPGLALPALDGQRQSRVVDDRGTSTAFATSTLLVFVETRAEAEAVAGRHGGRVVDHVDPMGLPGVLPVWVVALPDLPGDRALVRRRLLALNEVDPGAMRVSDELGLGTLEVALAEAEAGVPVALDFAARSDSYADSVLDESDEALSRPNLGNSDNPFDWEWIADGTTMDHGVSAAWRLLDALDLLVDDSVNAAVLDGGFSETNDLSTTYTAVSGVASVPDPMGAPNPTGCGASPCEWHATGVSHVLHAEHDNNLGVAGVATPVAYPTFAYSGSFARNELAALVQLAALDVDIVNMSFGHEILGGLGVLGRPLYSYHTALDELGILLVASAGNDGADNDAERCNSLGVCIEASWKMPCEHSAVLCVGGLEHGTTNRDSASNYGDEVRIYAPFSVWVGEDPDNPGDVLQSTSGTSYSAPYVAGVAALVWAGNPALGDDEVEALLLSTAQPSGDPDVPAVVDAFEAVQQATSTRMWSGHVGDEEASDLLELPMVASSRASIRLRTYADDTYGAHGVLDVYNAAGEETWDDDFLSSGGVWETWEYTEYGHVGAEVHPDTLQVVSAYGGFTWDLLVTVADREGANAAGGSLAESVAMDLPASVSGNLRGEEAGHYLTVTIPAGESLWAYGTATASSTRGAHLVVNLYETDGAEIDTRFISEAVYGTESVSETWLNDSGVDLDVVVHVENTTNAEGWELTDYELTLELL